MMDYRDKLAGINHNYFANKAQLFLIDMLFKKLKVKRKLSILSVGCGDGHELNVLNKHGDVDILDINKESIKLIPKKLYSKVFIDDICRFKGKKRYDVIVGFDVLEHIKNDFAAVKKIHELLKPRGYFLFTVPAHKALFGAHDKELHHFRRYSKKRLRRLFKGRFRIRFLSYRYFFIFFPVVINRMVNKHSKPKILAPKIPKFINELLFLILRFEIWLMKYRIALPFGISLVGICKWIK